MDIIIGSARHDEKGAYAGGAKGDSVQSSTPDYKGEVSMQKFYVHSKGWNIIRAKSGIVANALAEAMRRACNNSNIGYSQSDRYGILSVGISTQQKCNCDCSSLVRQCVKEATGMDPKDFTTGNASKVLAATGFFKDVIPYKSRVTLYTGDILCTQTKGHIVIVVDGNKRASEEKTVVTPTSNDKIRSTSANGIQLIKNFERCRLTAYKPVATETYYTIGFGHYGAEVTQGMVITQKQADDLLSADLVRFEKAVHNTGLKLNQNQFDALVSFAFNCGTGNLANLVKGRTLAQIADAIPLYNKSGGKVLAGLVKRRRMEKQLFLTSTANTNPYTEPTKDVKLGTTGNDAQWLQWMLNQHGYGLTVDGNCGAKTISALKSFQKQHELIADGICGAKTRTILNTSL